MLRNLNAKPISNRPNTTLTLFNQPPLWGKLLSQPGKAENNPNGRARADEKPSITAVGAAKDPVAAPARAEPTRGPGAGEGHNGQGCGHEEDANDATTVRCSVCFVGPARRQLNFKGSKKARSKHDEQQKQEHVENGVGGDDIEHIHTEERGQRQPQCGVDEDDEEPVDEGVADAFSTRFGLLGEEAHRHGNHGEDTRGQQGSQPQPKPQQERPQEAFFAFFICAFLIAVRGRSPFSKHAVLTMFMAAVVFASVVTPMLWLRTVIGPVGFRSDV